ncbi:hypothetical protein RhiirA1_470353 [Rhizophagus irregularis]|uniref:Uncharacterized protein n=1 Tax=Rhizophagus irregularis TaxID=588596 RepID=A0A2N0R6C0_9GLOM|nr:hypothetical protein RhiirA1_470353 [Rhizophagus irregularis]
MRKREYKDATELEDDDDETTDDRLRTNTNEELEMEFYLYMLEKWKRMEPALNLLAADNPNVRQRYLTDFDCINIDDTMVLLSPIERVIRFLSAFSYPTHGDIRFVFSAFRNIYLDISDERFSQRLLSDHSCVFSYCDRCDLSKIK